MKNIVIFSIRFYQSFLSVILRQITGQSQFCRFSPTCSQYAIQAVKKHGAVRGMLQAVVRILHCQPFSKTYGTTI